MTNKNHDQAGGRGLTLVFGEPTDGLLPSEHRHAWELVTTQTGLHSAQTSLGWDVAASRIVGVNKCGVCGHLHRGSVRECRLKHCRAHPICEHTAP